MRATLLLTSLLAAGCATYAAHPLETGGVAERYRARRLDDSAVVVALESLGVSARPIAWHEWELAEAKCSVAATSSSAIICFIG